MKFLLMRSVKAPQRAYGDAGIDCFVPHQTKEFEKVMREKNPDIEFTEIGFIVKPQQAVLIPLGIKSSFEPNIALMANNKSGVATKKQLVFGAQLIDSNYQGEIHAHLINTGTEDQKIYYGDKIIQFVPVYINSDEFTVETDEDNFYATKSERGEGGFGSTGDK